MRFQRREVVFALLVVAVPAVASIWAAEIAAAPWWLKVLLTLIWIVSAGKVIFGGLLKDERLLHLAEATRVKRNQLRRQALEDAYEGILGGTRFGRSWSFTVYVFDEEQNLLVPSWPLPDSEKVERIKSFPPWVGATGQAWEREQLIVRKGKEVSDGTHGLTEEQQAYFADRGTVVSIPIWSDLDEKIGVLSAIRDDEHNYFDDQARRSDLAAVASSIGALIVSLGAIE